MWWWSMLTRLMPTRSCWNTLARWDTVEEVEPVMLALCWWGQHLQIGHFHYNVEDCLSMFKSSVTDMYIYTHTYILETQVLAMIYLRLVLFSTHFRMGHVPGLGRGRAIGGVDGGGPGWPGVFLRRHRLFLGHLDHLDLDLDRTEGKGKKRMEKS